MSGAELVLHIGLHKTGTTYLQQAVFPRWPGLAYERWRNLEYLIRLDRDRTHLISCEGLSGRTFAKLPERCAGLHRLAAMLPDAKPVIGFRRHGGFLASLYSQYLRYGGQGRFDEFFAWSGSGQGGFIDRRDISFATLIDEAHAAFGRPPFVFTMEDMFADMERFLSDLAAYIGLPPPPMARISKSVRNRGLGGWQGGLLRRANAMTDARFSYDGRNRPYAGLARWRLDPPTVCIELLGRLPSGPLVPAPARRAIDALYADDWAQVVDHERRCRGGAGAPPAG